MMNERHRHNHIYYHSHELDVVLLGHDVRNFYADIVARYGNLGQMLRRITVAVRFVDRLEVSLQKRRELTRWYEVNEIDEHVKCRSRHHLHSRHLDSR